MAALRRGSGREGPSQWICCRLGVHWPLMMVADTRAAQLSHQNVCQHGTGRGWSSRIAVRRGSATGEPRRGGPPARTSSAAAGHWPAVSHPQLRSCRSWPGPAAATLSYLGHVSEEERSRRPLEVFNPLLLHISIKHGSGAENKNLSQIFCWSCDEITFCFAVKVLFEDYDESMVLCNVDRRVGSGSLAITLWGLLNTDWQSNVGCKHDIE